MSSGICGFLLEDEQHMAATVPHGTVKWRDLQRTRLKHTKESIRALQAHIDTLQARLDALDSERCQLEETLDSFVYPITSIPVEIASQIFLDCLPANGRVRPSISSAPVSLAQVNHHWREIAVSIPHLWRSIDLQLGHLIFGDFGDGYVCCLLKTWFRRTNGHPLSITLRLHGGFDTIPPNILSTIAEFSEQWGRLEILIPRKAAHVAALGSIHGPFPQLHTFALAFSEPHGEILPLDCLATFQDAPQLRKLRGLHLADLRASATLTSLELVHERLSLAEWARLFDHFPVLLHLSATHDFSSDLQPLGQVSMKNPPLTSLNIKSGNPLPILTLPRLRHLRYPLASSSFSTSAFLSFVTRSTCPLQSLTLSVPLWDDDVYLNCLRAVPSLVKLDIRPWNRRHKFYQHMESPAFLPQLMDLVVEEDGYMYDYAPLLRMLRARRAMLPPSVRLHSVSLALDVSGSDDPDHDLSPPEHIVYRLRRLVDDGLRFHVDSRAQGVLWPTDFYDDERDFP
ncbi:hypothetical protein GGX14DRAFT_582054 [Mycena pura]|uniref:F-box domain-containing protein n=1 Tax=Mycena pura TaxID=153505 RepID=A0AAD7E645_9AGAR|nr:hypothetical protein GGX14DRAFT_582054 [Mycena pura]